jgi:ankyrin repeat protein
MTEERDRDGRTPLHEAVFQGRSSAVERLLEDGVDPDARDNGGRTPLHFAAQEYRPQEARLLCMGGAAVDARDSFGNTPLWRATFDSRGRGEVIRVLLEHGADPDFVNNAGVSPRQLAERIGNYDVGQYFAE